MHNLENIKTNFQYRDILSWYDLAPKEQAEFNYIKDQNRAEWSEFFRYRGNVYDLGDFSRIITEHRPGFYHYTEPDSPLAQWEAIASDSYFSGVVIKYNEDHSKIIVGVYSI